MDKQLRWRDYINYTIQRRKGALRILTTLSRIKWGADKFILLHIFDILLRSRIDYGSAIYSSARKSWLQQLDRVYVSGLRVAKGAFRTSPLDSIYVESGHLPPGLRRHLLTLSCTASLRAKANHFLHDTVMDRNTPDKYSTRRTTNMY